MNQKKGKIYETETYTTKCECGEIVTQEYYKKFDVDVKSDFDMFIGFCQCGNIFVAQYPMEVEKNKTRDEGRQIVERWWDTHPLDDAGWIPIALALAKTQ